MRTAHYVTRIAIVLALLPLGPRDSVQSAGVPADGRWEGDVAAVPPETSGSRCHRAADHRDQGLSGEVSLGVGRWRLHLAPHPDDGRPAAVPRGVGARCGASTTHSSECNRNLVRNSLGDPNLVPDVDRRDSSRPHGVAEPRLRPRQRSHAHLRRRFVGDATERHVGTDAGPESHLEQARCHECASRSNEPLLRIRVSGRPPRRVRRRDSGNAVRHDERDVGARPRDERMVDAHSRSCSTRGRRSRGRVRPHQRSAADLRRVVSRRVVARPGRTRYMESACSDEQAHARRPAVSRVRCILRQVSCSFRATRSTMLWNLVWERGPWS